MTLREICVAYGYTQTELSRRFDIPLRTVQGWHNETRKPPEYVLRMISEILEKEKNGG